MVFGWGADGNSYPVGEFVAGHGSDDHAFLQHFFEDLVSFADTYEDEICDGWYEFETALFESSFVKCETLAVDCASFLDVILIVQRGQCSGLSHGIGVEGLARFFEQFCDGFWRDAVSDPQRRETMNLGASAQNDDVFSCTDMFENIRRGIKKLKVSFIEYSDGVSGKFFDKAIDGFLGDHRASRIVGVGDKHEARLIRDRGGHRFEIVDEIRIIDFDVFRAKKRGHQFINDEGVLGGDEFGIAVEESVAEKLNDFVRTVAKDDVGNIEAEFIGDGSAEFKAAAVWIDVGLGNRIAHRLLREWRRAEWIFVRSNFDDGCWIESEFASGFFDRFSGFVSNEVTNKGIGEIRNRHDGNRVQFYRNVERKE